MSTTTYNTEVAFPRPRFAAMEPEPVNMARVHDMVGDDPADVRQLVDLYLSEARDTMGRLRAAIHAGAVSETERLAHKLGGSSATCGMIGIVAPLAELECSGKAGEWPENEELLMEADRQHGRIYAYLAAHVLKN